MSDGPVVILYEPQNPWNIGSAVRACRNFGAVELRLIRPASAEKERIAVTAPHGDEFIEQHLHILQTWEEAVAGLTHLVAFSARSREERQPRLPLEHAAQTWAYEHERVGLVFGREDHGLPNHAIERCDVLVQIDTASDAASLNLAQAVIVVLHRAFEARHGVRSAPGPTREFVAAEKQQVERMFGQLEVVLESMAFFKGDQQANVMRTFRRIAVKAELDSQELATLWALVAETRRLQAAGSTGTKVD
ncbi:MAG: tRNA/rRNA methyltransferase [Bradymonadia bacterium]